MKTQICLFDFILTLEFELNTIYSSITINLYQVGSLNKYNSLCTRFRVAP